MSESKEKIKIIGPLARFFATLVLGAFLTLAYLFCNVNPDGFVCDMPNFTAQEMPNELDT
jgi:hypothetical protein